jgi:hypothetical protein
LTFLTIVGGASRTAGDQGVHYMKALKLLLVIAALGVIAYFAAQYARDDAPNDLGPLEEQQRTQDDQTRPKREAPKLEERYGFTGETPGG